MSLSTNYLVSIANSTGAAPNDGFVDRMTIEQYMAAGPGPTSYTQSQAKERANVRWLFLVQQLGLMANCYVSQDVATGGSSTTEANPLVFHLEIERGDSVLQTPDETTPGATLVGAAAIARCIARALIETRTTVRDMYDPTLASTPGNSTLSSRFGVRLDQLVTGPAAASLAAATALITVTKL